MIAISKLKTSVHEKFLSMLPLIKRLASNAFRGLPEDDRQDLIAEVVANAYVAYMRLVQLEKQDIAYSTPLANFAIRQVCAGRRVGGKLNVRDVTSRHCQKQKAIQVKSLFHWDELREQWKELLIADKTVTPAELAASRIDFPAWLNTLSPRNRRIALALGSGESGKNVASSFRLSEGRICQLRQQLQASWEQFHAPTL